MPLRSHPVTLGGIKFPSQKSADLLLWMRRLLEGVARFSRAGRRVRDGAAKARSKTSARIDWRPHN